MQLNKGYTQRCWNSRSKKKVKKKQTCFVPVFARNDHLPAAFEHPSQAWISLEIPGHSDTSFSPNMHFLTRVSSPLQHVSDVLKQVLQEAHVVHPVYWEFHLLKNVTNLIFPFLVSFIIMWTKSAQKIGQNDVSEKK